MQIQERLVRTSTLNGSWCRQHSSETYSISEGHECRRWRRLKSSPCFGIKSRLFCSERRFSRREVFQMCCGDSQRRGQPSRDMTHREKNSLRLCFFAGVLQMQKCVARKHPSASIQRVEVTDRTGHTTTHTQPSLTDTGTEDWVPRGGAAESHRYSKRN